LSQTNIPFSKVAEISIYQLLKQNRSHLYLVLIFIALFLTTACGTKPKVQSTEKTTTAIVKDISEAKTAQEKITLAQSINVQNTGSIEEQLALQIEIDELLISASELLLVQQDFSQAVWLANETLLLSQQYNNIYRLLLVKAKGLHALNFHQQAEHQLKLAKALSIASDDISQSLALTFDYYLTLRKVLTAQGQKVLAIAAQLNAFSLNENASTSDVIAIWHELESLAQWQVTQLVKTKADYIKGWQQLLEYGHKFGANPEQFSRYLNVWQQQNPTHPAIAIIDLLKSAPVTMGEMVNIAILLPLSGSQQNAGLAAQQGVLAAYNSNSTSNIHFIDTNNIDWTTIAIDFSKLNIDHIIGPLLKANVASFLALSVQEPALQVPTLLLNLPSQHELATYQVALSMRPEDEAIQAAATLSQMNYQHPIILSYQDRISRRIAQAYSQQWQKSTGNAVDIVYFDQGKEMQASLKESLDVNTSQTRISQLNSRLKHTIKSEPRNRRDIDMIYLVGSAAQTRLIKPYIDVNTSPFASIIPVYASSRSHSNFNDKHNASSTNDLQGLTFSQIPWLLSSQQQNKPLNKLSDDLWPKRTDSLSSIFAMGFDSFQLLNKTTLMQQAPYVRHFGQTGVLRLNEKNILTRSLIWGQYQNDKVQQVAMD